MTETPGGDRSWAQDAQPEDDAPAGQTPQDRYDEQPADHVEAPDTGTSPEAQADAELDAAAGREPEPEPEVVPEPEPAPEADAEPEPAPESAPEPEPGPAVVPEPQAPVAADPAPETEALGGSAEAEVPGVPGEEGPDEAAPGVEDDAVAVPEPSGAEVPPVEEPVAAEVPAVEEAAVADEEPLEVEAAEPATPDPSPAVAAPPLVDPVAVEPAAADEPLAEGEADAPVPAPRSGMGLLGTLLAVVVVLVVLTTYLAVRVVTTRDGGPTEKARLEALQAARTASRVLFSYDYRHLDKDFAAGKPYTTGSFAKEYQRSTGRVRASATQTKRVVVAEVSEAGVVRATKNQVVALIFLNQQFTSTASVSTRVTLNRLELTMDRRDGRWLVSRIRAF